jgi:acylphosphatase
MTQGRKTVFARISGRVQGVGFRFWTQQEAEQLHLDGWVRNEDDGSVSAMISGSEPAVSTMLDLLREGPRGAAVTQVDIRETDRQTPPSGFHIAG